MKYLFDTDHISFLQRRSGSEYANLAARIATSSPADFTFSVAPVLPFDAGAAAIFDGLRAQRVRIATMDLRIASIALARGLILLTRNTRDFNQVPGLITQDWTIDC